MNTTQRRIAAEKLHSAGSLMAHLQHELYRIHKIHGSGLSEKEQAVIQKCEFDLKSIIHRTTVMRKRCA